MSRDYHNICGKILESNKELHSNPNTILKEIESVKKDIKRISLTIEELYRLVLEIKDNNTY